MLCCITFVSMSYRYFTATIKNLKKNLLIKPRSQVRCYHVEPTCDDLTTSEIQLIWVTVVIQIIFHFNAISRQTENYQSVGRRPANKRNLGVEGTLVLIGRRRTTTTLCNCNCRHRRCYCCRCKHIIDIRTEIMRINMTVITVTMIMMMLTVLLSFSVIINHYLLLVLS